MKRTTGLLTILFLCWVLGCITSQAPPREWLLYSKIGRTPFSDSIELISPDGRKHRTLLAPEHTRSFLFASAVSQRGPFLILVHGKDEQKVRDALFLYESGYRWTPLAQDPGRVGRGLFDPSGKWMAFNFAAFRQQTSSYAVWLESRTNHETLQLTHPDEVDTRDQVQAWHPLADRILFLRIKHTTRGVTTKLMSIELGSKTMTVLVGDSGVSAGCYSPDGRSVAFISNAGLEILSLTDHTRKILLSWLQLDGYRFKGGGIAWSRFTNSIAFPMFDTKTGKSVLLTVSVGTSRLVRVREESDGDINGVSFIAN